MNEAKKVREALEHMRDDSNDTETHALALAGLTALDVLELDLMSDQALASRAWARMDDAHKALKFYAERDNFTGYADEGDQDHEPAAVQADMGDKARAALAAVGYTEEPAPPTLKSEPGPYDFQDFP